MGLLKYFSDWKKLQSRLKKSFEKANKEISDKANKEDLKDLKIETDKNKEKIARLEGALAVIMQKSQVSVSPSLRQSHNKIETKVLKRIKRDKKAVVMAEIKKLMGSMSIIEIKNLIVDEKGLCSKASFYRYIESLKSQSQVSVRLKAKLDH